MPSRRWTWACTCRLSVMMFLQFAVWGSWFTVFNVYCGTPKDQGGLGFDGYQIGSLYSTMALGAIISTMLAGQLADRVLSSEYLMVIFHLVGAVLLYAMVHIHDYNLLWWVALAYALSLQPDAGNLQLDFILEDSRRHARFSTTARARHHWVDRCRPGRRFPPPHRLGQDQSPVADGGRAFGGARSLKHRASSYSAEWEEGGCDPIRPVKLLHPSFGIFFGISFVITIALAFYYNFAGNFLKDSGVQRVASMQTIGQMSEIFFMLMLPFALKRFGMKGVLTVGMAAWAVHYGFFSLGHPFALIVIGVALHGVCFDFFLAAGFIHTDNKVAFQHPRISAVLFSFLTYGVGMYIGNLVAGAIVKHFTTPDGVAHWSKIWAVPAIGAAFCLALFIVLWRDKPGKVEDEKIDTIAEMAASPGSPDQVSQTAN